MRLGKVRLAFVLGIVCSSLPALGHWSSLASKTGPNHIEDAPAIAAQVNKLAAPELMPESRWLTKVKEHFSTKLPKADTLVLPPQVQGFGLSQALRGVFGEMVIEVVTGNGERVPAGAFELQHLLGRTRSISADDINELAGHAHVKRIIQPHIGWLRGPNQTKHLVVTLQDGRRSEGGSWDFRTSPPVHARLDAQLSPFDAFQSALEQHLDWLGYRPIRKSKTNLPLVAAALPPLLWSTEEAQNATPMQNVAYLQWMGVLTPESSGFRKELFGRSLLTLRSMHNKGGELNSWFARAYAELGMVALSRKIATQGDSACYQHEIFRHLSALRECARLGPSLERPLLYFDALKIAKARDLPLTEYLNDLSNALSATPNWLPFVTSQLQGSDLWAPVEHEWLKLQMDERYPVDGYTMDHVVALQMTDRSAFAMERVLAPAKHYALLVERHAGRLLSHGVNRPSVDRLRLMQAHTLHGIYRLTYRTIKLQARPDAALPLIERVEGQLSGHPLVAYLRALYHGQMADSVSDHTTKHHTEQKIEYASRATFWSDGNTFETDVSESLRLPRPARSTFRPWQSDFPIALTKITTNERAINPFVHEAANFNVFRTTVFGLFSKDQQLGELENYFLDHPDRGQIFIDQYVTKADWNRAIPLIEAELKRDPEDFRYYKKLGDAYFRLGEPDKAAAAYRRYPAFVEIREDDSLKYGNQAHEVAVELGLAGRRDLAEHFHEIVLKYPSGSGANYASATWLSIQNDDFDSALSYAFQRVQRYPNAGSFAEYFGLLSTFSQPREVLAAFDNYASSQRSMIAWIPAHVAQRVLGWDSDDIVEWLRRDHLSELRKPRNARMIHYARAITMDRGVVELDLDFIRDEMPVMVFCGGRRMNLESFRNFEGAVLEDGPSGMKIQCVSAMNGERVTGEIERNEFEAYLKMRNFAEGGHFDKAFEILISGFEPPYQGHSHAFPLMAWILMELNEEEMFESIVEFGGAGYNNMQRELARAIRHAYLGDHTTAIHHIDKALGFRLGTGNRLIVSPYLIGHTMYLLWDKTGESIYREKAAEYSRSRSREYNGYAWPFALLAHASQDEEEKVEAATKAFYLDPQSRWFELLPTDLQSKARERASKQNPFITMLEDLSATANPPTSS